MQEEDNGLELEDKTVAILAYITIIGFIIALVLNASKEGEEKSYGAFHLRQALGLFVVALAAGLVLSIASAILVAISFGLLGFITSLTTIAFVLAIIGYMIIGALNAASGQRKELPLFGAYVQKNLAQAFE
jgi:phosphotransferase system  glucose/maltose/N-acetylglucosamine-specific IIC component